MLSSIIPLLDSAGKIPLQYIPSNLIPQTYVVNSQAAMLALSVANGSVAIRNDTGVSYILQQQPPSTLANWVQLGNYISVNSVAGKTGNVSLVAADITDLSGILVGKATAAQGAKADTAVQPSTISQNFFYKSPVRVATNTNITLSGLQTIDGIGIAAGDRVLVLSQTTGSQNGIYVAASGAWTRATDFDTGSVLIKGVQVYVTDGNTYGSTTYILNTSNIIIGTTTILFSTASGATGGATAAQGAKADTALQPGTAISNINGLQSALDAKQASLGFSPVQQGTGPNQLGNSVKIGWRSGNTLGLAVDTVDFGFVWPISISGDAASLSGTSLSAINSAIAAKQATLGFTPVQQGTGVNQLNNVVKIGFRTGGTLGLSIDNTDFGFTWPISITGDSGSVGGVAPGDIVRSNSQALNDAQKLQARINVGLSPNENVRTIPTLSLAANVNLANENSVRITAYSSTSRPCPALYVKVGSQPTHGLKFQDASGAWFEIAESVIQVEMAGAVWGDGATDCASAFQLAINAAGTRSAVYSAYAQVAATGPAYLISSPVYVYGANSGDQIDVNFTGRMFLRGSGTFVLGDSTKFIGSGRIKFGTVTAITSSNPCIIVRGMYASSLDWMDISGLNSNSVTVGILIQPNGTACCDNVYRGNRVININGYGIQMDNSLGVISQGKNWHMQNSFFEVNFIQSCQIGFFKQCNTSNAPMDLTTFIGALDFNTNNDIYDQQPNSNSFYLLRYHDDAKTYATGGSLIGTGIDTSVVIKMNRGSTGAAGMFFGVGNERAGFVSYGELMFMTSTAIDPSYNGQVVFQRNSNTQGVFKMKGTDGTIRSATLTFS